jgi:PTS system mannose-specific IIB component
MTLRLVRVDDRLIHGQVIVVWLGALGAEVIVVVDDATARDEFLRDVLVYAAPPGVEVEVYDTSAAPARLKELADSPTPAFVLMKTPVTALQLCEDGVEFTVLNIGGIGATPGRRVLYKSISASAEEIDAMHQLESLGTRVEFQIVPESRSIPLRSVVPRR